MGLFDLPVETYMTAPRVRVTPETHLPEVARLLELHAISGVPVLDERQRLRGVITRTDLLHQGAVPHVSGGRDTRLAPPDRRVADVIHAEPRTVPLGASMAEAVRMMHQERIHRVCVVDGPALVGVFSAWDVMRLLADRGCDVPLSRLMSPDVRMVSPSTPTLEALAQLQDSHMHALLVVDGRRPLGVFSLREALLAERSSVPGEVEAWFDPRVLSLPPDTDAGRAAQRALSTSTRRIAVVSAQGIQGIVTPWDFTRVEQG